MIHEDLNRFSFPSFSELKKEFKEVSVFQDREWIRRWFREQAKRQPIKPFIVVVKDNGKTIGIFPMYSYQATFRFTILKPIGGDTSDYLIPLIAKQYCEKRIFAKVWRTLYSNKTKWDSIIWPNLPAFTLLDQQAPVMHKGMKCIARKKGANCPYISFEGPSKELKSYLNKKYVKKIEFKERKLARQQGAFQYNKVTSEGKIEEVMNVLFQLHCKRWAVTGRFSPYENIEERNRALSLAFGLFQSNLLHLSYLKIGDKIIAVHFGMGDGERFYYYIPAFDTEYNKYSVGQILIYRLMQDVFQEGYQVFDFLRGSESYKYDWGAKEAFNVERIFVNDTMKSKMFVVVYKIQQYMFSNRMLRRMLDKWIALKGNRKKAQLD